MFAVFISLLALSLLPRKHGEEELPGLLPWERATTGMQALKSTHLYHQMQWELIQPDAISLLKPLHSELFRLEKPDVSVVCSLMESKWTGSVECAMECECFRNTFILIRNSVDGLPFVGCAFCALQISALALSRKMWSKKIYLR